MRFSQFDSQRQLLAAEFRRLRKAAGLTGVQLAARAGISQSKISKLETGRLLPKPEDVQAIALAIGSDDAVARELQDRIRVLSTEVASWRIAHKGGLANNQLDIARLEQDASIVRVCQLAIVPGLLQTAEYARRVISLANISGQPDVEAAVLERVRRQVILADKKRSFCFVIAEAALRARILPREQMLAQLARIRSVATMTHVELALLPLEAELSVLPLHGFVLFDEQLATVETIAADVVIADVQDLQLYRYTFDSLMAASVCGRDAVQMLSALLPLRGKGRHGKG